MYANILKYYWRIKVFISTEACLSTIPQATTHNRAIRRSYTLGRQRYNWPRYLICIWWLRFWETKSNRIWIWTCARLTHCHHAGSWWGDSSELETRLWSPNYLSKISKIPPRFPACPYKSCSRTLWRTNFLKPWFRASRCSDKYFFYNLVMPHFTF